MTGTEFFWGLAINWISAAAQAAGQPLFAPNTYLQEMNIVFEKTKKEYKKKYPPSKDKGDKHFFYESQYFIEACQQFSFYENIDTKKVYDYIERNKKKSERGDSYMLPTSIEEISSFLEILSTNIRTNKKLEKAYQEENYKNEIFALSKQLKELIETINKDRNSIIIQGNNNIVVQDAKRFILNIQNKEIEKELNRKEKLSEYQKEAAAEYVQPIWGEAEMSLKDIYILQKFGIYRACLKEQAEISRPWGGLFEPMPDTHLHEFIDEWIKQKDIPSSFKHSVAVKNPRLILLLGQPGQGKSSFCKRLMHDVFNDAKLQTQPILRINIRDITNVEELINRPFVFLQSFLEKEKHLLDIDDGYFSNCLLVLDGLDELRIKENMGTKGETDFLNNLATDLKRNYPNMRLIVTSRYQVAIEQFKGEFLVLNFSLLSQGDMDTWLDQYKQFHPEAALTKGNIGAFLQKPHLKELCEQPILLYLLAQVHTAENPITEDTNKARLYDQLFEHVIARKWADEQVLALKNVEQDQLRLFLQEVAFAIFQSDQEYIHKTALEKVVKNHPRLNVMDNLLSKDALRGLMMAFYMRETPKTQSDPERQEDKSNYGIEFMHKSLQEFLAAEKIWEAMQDLLEKNRHQEYAISEGKKCLELLYKCFHAQFLSPNVRNLLVEIIDNDTKTDKELLADRMGRFFAYCLEKDFLYQYDLDRDQNPISHGLNVFYGFWTVLAALPLPKGNKYRNISQDKAKKFAGLLIYLSRYQYECILNLSLANLSGADLSLANLSGADLSGANLSQANLSRANLSGANLSLANLRGANLSGADLSEANLSEANLSWADLWEANLRGASLCQADLSWANLSEADLSEADLSGADLSGADLRKVDLRKADLRGADLRKVDLRKADLSGADLGLANLREANLSEAKLRGISHLSFAQLSQVETLYEARGLPESLEEELREKCPQLFDAPII